MMTLNKLKSLDKDDLLGMLGLETQHSHANDFIFPAIALFGVGILVGTGIGLLVAPRPGRELREDLTHRLQNAPDAIARLPEKANAAFQRASDQFQERSQDVQRTEKFTDIKV